MKTATSSMVGKCVNKNDGFHQIFNTGGWGNRFTTKKDAIQSMEDTNRWSEAKHGERVVNRVVSVKNGEVVAEYYK